MVGTDPENDPTPCTLKPPLLTLSHNYPPSPERPGSLTPPIFSSAAVPFRWEESPGKPKPCTAITIAAVDISRKSLDLPPRLLTNQLSPTAVSDAGRFKYQSQSSSFRMVAGECYGSFREASGSPETASFRAVVVSRKRKGLVGYWKRRELKGKREVGVGGGSYVFPSSADRDLDSVSDGEGEDRVNGDGTSVKITRAGNFSVVSTAKPRFWAGMYEGLKHAVPWSWRSKKTNKGI